MSATVEDLLGAWTLERWSLIYEDGRPPEYPLGPDARGLIMYTADGHVAAALMRAGRTAAVPDSDAARAAAYADSFAYAGRFEVRDGTVFHTIEIATNPALVGFRSTRHIQTRRRMPDAFGARFHARRGALPADRLATRNSKG